MSDSRLQSIGLQLKNIESEYESAILAEKAAEDAVSKISIENKECERRLFEEKGIYLETRKRKLDLEGILRSDTIKRDELQEKLDSLRFTIEKRKTDEDDIKNFALKSQVSAYYQ